MQGGRETSHVRPKTSDVESTIPPCLSTAHLELSGNHDDILPSCRTDLGMGKGTAVSGHKYKNWFNLARARSWCDEATTAKLRTSIDYIRSSAMLVLQQYCERKPTQLHYCAPCCTKAIHEARTTMLNELPHTHAVWYLLENRRIFRSYAI